MFRDRERVSERAGDSNLFRAAPRFAPRSLLRYNHDDESWAGIAEHETKVPPAAAKQYAALYSARSEEALVQAMADFGVTGEDEPNLRRFWHVLHDYAVVAIGPSALPFWKLAVVGGEGRRPHTDAVCLCCSPFVVSGTCEHVHAVLIDAGVIQNTVSSKPVRKKHVALTFRTEKGSVAAARVADARPEPPVDDVLEAISAAMPPSLAKLTAKQRAELSLILRRAAADRYFDILVSAGMGAQQLRRWTRRELVDVFGTTEAVASCILAAARNVESEAAVRSF